MKVIPLIITLSIAAIAANYYQPEAIPNVFAWEYTKPKPPTKEEIALAAKNIKAMRDDGSITNVINTLIKDGTLCSIRGHQWQDGCSMGPGCAVLHNAPMRHCALCLTQQSQWSEWK